MTFTLQEPVFMNVSFTKVRRCAIFGGLMKANHTAVLACIFVAFSFFAEHASL